MEYEVQIDGIYLEYVLELKYLGSVLDKSGTSGSKVAGSIRSLVNARSLQLECVKFLHESLLMPVLTYGSETGIWEEKERSRIGSVQMDNIKGLLGIRRMDKIQNAWIKQLYGVMKDVDEKTGVLQWFSHVERMEKDRIAKRVYVVCAGSRSVHRSWNRWINTVKECFKKRGLDVRQAGRMVHERSLLSL